MTIEEAFELIKKKDLNHAIKYFNDSLKNECINIIQHEAKNIEFSRALDIYYDAFLELTSDVESCKFIFVDKPKAIAYFKQKCRLKSFEYSRIARKNQSLEKTVNDFENSIDHITDDDFSEDYNKIKSTEYFKIYNEYGIELSGDKSNEKKHQDIVNAFHKLADKCKILIILKHIIGLKHQEIVMKLNTFYPMRNEAVSRVTLRRCLDKLMELSLN